MIKDFKYLAAYSIPLVTVFFVEPRWLGNVWHRFLRFCYSAHSRLDVWEREKKP